jgi:hypothetical protein
MFGFKTSGGAKTTPMTVKNTGFLLDRLGQDCHPLQFLRELTRNAIEAIQRTGSPGQVLWDVDWTTYDLAGVLKLCVIDTGDGMSGSEMVEHINKLSSSTSEQSLTGNYGVGAKIAAATRNHEGMLYLSWKDGRGSMIHLWRNPEDGVYGLKQITRGDGTYGEFLDLEDTVKPEQIVNHGTMIVLLGSSEGANTMQAPPGAASPSRWIAKYLNTRFFRFPADINVKAREGWEHPRSDGARNKLRTVTGQEHYLAEHAAASGIVQLTDAVVHWWILRDSDALNQDENYFASSGHVAALYQDELYELSTGRSGTARLQLFGVIFGTRQVVLYVEPAGGEESGLTTNTARTNLLLNNEALAWADWAAEFRDEMPAQIEDFIAQKAAASSMRDHSQTVRDRLKSIIDLFKISRYRPSPSGALLIDDEQRVRGGGISRRKDAGLETGAESASSSHGGKGSTLGNVYTLFERKDGVAGSKVQPDPFPKWKWISVKDHTRESNDLEDRAAKFLTEQNLLLINADFRVFSDMVKRWHTDFGGNEAIRNTVEDVVRTWFEQALVETVVGVQALQGSKEWDQRAIQAALSEESLTAAVMQRYHVNNSIKRELGSKLGKLQVA